MINFHTTRRYFKDINFVAIMILNIVHYLTPCCVCYINNNAQERMSTYKYLFVGQFYDGIPAATGNILLQALSY
jgi:hypothetical protein